MRAGSWYEIAGRRDYDDFPNVTCSLDILESESITVDLNTAPRDYEAQVWKAEKARKPRDLRHSRAESSFCKGFHGVAQIRVFLRSFRASAERSARHNVHRWD
jgi:predicted nucleic acid-binding protein